jgi:uncharacterized protein
VFSWNISKATKNFEKHRVSFEEAATVFIDDNGLDWDDLDHSSEERRFKRLGRSVENRILMIAYTLRSSANGKETIRIISARQASVRERKAYFRS